MKHLFFIIFLIITFNTFGQTEILDSIRNVQLKKIPESGKNFSTFSYWDEEIDGGIMGFIQISEWPEEVELKLYKEQINKNRAVLTSDIYYKGSQEDRIYIFLIKESDTWLIDGIHETKELIPHFLEAYYSGHFSPYDLPGDNDLKELGENIISFGKNKDEMLIYLKKNTAPGSTYDLITELTADTDLEPFFLNTYGFDERINKGYINFWAFDKSKESITGSEITIYVSKTENSKIKILNMGLSGPSKTYFLSE